MASGQRDYGLSEATLMKRRSKRYVTKTPPQSLELCDAEVSKGS